MIRTYKVAIVAEKQTKNKVRFHEVASSHEPVMGIAYINNKLIPAGATVTLIVQVDDGLTQGENKTLDFTAERQNWVSFPNPKEHDEPKLYDVM